MKTSTSRFKKTPVHPMLALCAMGLVASLGLTACQNGPFARHPTPEPRYVPDIVLGDAQVLTILPTRVACASALPMQCMLAQQAGDANVFQIPYSWIEGFDPRANVQYQISVRPQIDNNTQTATGQWTLQHILTQTIIQQP